MSLDMFPDSFVDYVIKAREKEDMEKETCRVCGKEVLVQIQKNTHLCGDNCRKIEAGEKDEPAAATDAGITALLSQPNGVNLRGIS